MILFNLIAIWTGLIYLAFLTLLIVGLKRLQKSHYEKDDSLLPTVSIVIAARDEEQRLGKLIDSLESQNYPRSKFEVIIIDDRSVDKTSDFARRRLEKNFRFQLLRVQDGETPLDRAPKKYALSKGIEIATGEIIVTTDADCWMGPRWLRSLVSPFVDPEVDGAAGVSRFLRTKDQNKPWWSDFESLEHLSYSVAAAGAIGAGHVFNAHGSNLAARRSVYERVGGYSSSEKIVSGDDVFLLQDIERHGGKVVWISSRDGYVYSKPVDSLHAWVNQRARWSSKGFYYPPYLRFLIVGTFSFYLTMLLAFPLAIFGLVSRNIPLILLLFRLISESAVMKGGCNRFNEELSIPKYILMQLLHGPAILFAGIRGQFFSFTWKGQKYSSKAGTSKWWEKLVGRKAA